MDQPGKVANPARGQLNRENEYSPVPVRNIRGCQSGSTWSAGQKKIRGMSTKLAWVREEEKASNQQQKKREAEEADKVEVAPGVTVASLRRFRIALIGPTQGLPKRRRLCR